MTPLGTLALALGTSIAKYLAKELLPKDWQAQIASELIGVGIGWIAKPEPTDQMGKDIGQRVKLVYDRSKAPDNEKQAAAVEVTRTLALARTHPQKLSELNLNSGRLHKTLIESRPEAKTLLSDDGKALYDQMLRVAAEGIVENAEQRPGFMTAMMGRMLEQQQELQEQHEKSSRLLRLASENLDAQSRRTAADQGGETVSLTEYTQRLRSRASRLDLPGIPGTNELQPKLDEIYVPLNRAFAEAVTSTALVHIEDKAGTGKSTLLKALVLHYCDLLLAGQESQVPVLSEARLLDLENGEPIETAILKRLKNHEGLNYQELYSLLQQGKLVLIVDGLDEAGKAKRLALFDAIRNSETIRQPSGNQLIIAGRHLQRAGIQGFKKVGLESLSLAGAYRLIRNWHRYLRTSAIPMRSVENLDALSRYVNDLDATGRELDSMIRIPLYLTYLITLAAHSESSDKVLTLTRSKIGLYRRVIEHAIPYWETHKRAEGEDILGTPTLPTMAAYRTLFAIAFVLQSRPQFVNQLQLFEALIADCHDYLRQVAEETIVSSFNYWVRASVLKIEPLEGSVEFWHYEMQEYCTARYLCANFPSPADMPEELAIVVYQDDWQQVRNLYDAICRRSDSNDDVSQT